MGKMRKFFIISVFVVSLILGSAIFCNVWAAIPPAQRAALIDLYNSTNGDSWLNKDNWKGINPAPDGFSEIGSEGIWHGVTVISDNVTDSVIVNPLLWIRLNSLR